MPPPSPPRYFVSFAHFFLFMSRVIYSIRSHREIFCFSTISAAPDDVYSLRSVLIYQWMRFYRCIWGTIFKLQGSVQEQIDWSYNLCHFLFEEETRSHSLSLCLCSTGAAVWTDCPSLAVPVHKHENIYLQFSLEKLLAPTKTPTHVKASIFLTKKFEQ